MSRKVKTIPLPLQGARKLKELKLPTTKKNTKVLTIWEIGNIHFNIIPTASDLKKYKDLVDEATKHGDSSIFVPEGLVRVHQITL